MPELEVRLLGVPTVTLAGERVSFDTRKALALLALLAVSRRDWAREELAALLWPESENTRARGSLRRTLVTAARAGPALRSERSRVGLEQNLAWCDVTEFRERVGEGLPDGDEAALRLWRGDFLAGFTLRDSPDFEDWSDDLRSSLRRDLDAVLSRLADRRVEEGRPDLALQHAQQRLKLDRLHEPAHRQVMSVLAAAGERAAALQQYRQCVRILDRELGVAPLPETTDLYEAVRRNEIRDNDAGDPGAATSVRGDRGALSTAGSPPRPPGQGDTFVGRELELAELAAAWASVAEAPQIVAIVGDTGMGKTHLAEHFLKVNNVVRVARVRGHEGEQRLAFGAAADLLRALADLGGGRLRLEPSDRARLASLVPGIAGHSGPAELLDTPGALARLYESVRSLVSSVAREMPVAVLLDDVEWFDAESQDLATFLLLRPPAGSMLLVSWRPANQPAVVVEAAGEALTTGHGRLLRLSALSRHEVTELSRQLGHDVDPDLLDRLVLRTGGVPLLVVEHALAGEARAERASPVTVEAAVAARLDRAPASTAQLLTAVAVLGAAADAELLQQVSGRSEIEVADALDDAVERRLLTTGASGLDFDFPHDSLRLVANGRTSPARRHLLHARAADALLQRRVRHPHSVRAATLGRLLEGAGRLDEASGWYVTAAHEAGTLSAHATAAAHLERALALGADPVHTHLKLGDARLRMGEYSAALADYENVVALSEDPLVLSAAEHKLAEVYDRLGDWELALGHLEAALGMTEPGPADHGGREPASTSGEQWQPSDAAAATARASVLADLALVGLRLGRLDASRAAAEQARRSAELADDATALVQALNVLAVLSLRLQETGQARALFEQAQDRAATLTDPGPLVAVLNNRARFEADQGEWDVAVDLAREALELGIRHGDRHRLAALHANLADVLHHTGREDEAREHLIRSASLFADVDREAERRPEVWKLVEW